MAPETLLDRPAETTLRDRALGRLSMAFLLDLITCGVGGLKTRDALLVMAVNQANIAPLTREPDARGRYGAMQRPAPDDRRRPVSINAVANSLCLPFETVRRHVKRLEAQGTCAVTPRGVIVPESFLVSPAYVASVLAAHHRLRLFYGEVSKGGFLATLPASTYPPQEAVPVRAAARLLSDYALRAAEQLTAQTGDIVSALVLLGMLSAPQPVTVAVLSRRLKMPAETVRRHTVYLIEQGLADRANQGVLITDHVLDQPVWVALFRDNRVNVQRLFAALAERGVIEAWEKA